MNRAFALPLLFASLLTLACGGGSEAPCAQPEVETTGESGHTARYSPFVLDVHGPQSLPFHVISFKDVGVSTDDDRSALYESIAESLANELMTVHPNASIDMSMMSEVRHDDAITDPASHVACEGGHIYVDVWRAGGEGDYGYSLWSGCGEDDRFAYNDHVAPGANGGGDLIASVEPLTRDIADALRSAVQTRCFQRHC